MEDAAIVKLYWDRDQQAIAASDEKYGPLCRTLSFRIVNSREDAEECVNDTWHRAWDTMPPQRPDSLRAYLCRIVRNLSISRYRARRSQKRGEGMEVLLSELEDCVPAVPSAEEAWENREIAAVIDRWLDGLEREVLEKTGVVMTLHLDPVVLGDEEAKDLEVRLRAAVEGSVEGMNIHDFRLVRGATKKAVFEVGVPFDCPVRDEEIENTLARAVRILGDYEPVITVERE